MKTIEDLKLQLVTNQTDNLLTDFDVNSFDKHGNNILHYYVKNVEAIAIDSETFLKMLLDAGLDINAPQSTSPENTALHLAVKQQEHKMVKLLIKYKAAIDPVNDNGNTPLWEAVMKYRNDDPFVIEFLLTNGADKHIENAHGASPQILSERIGNYDSESLLNKF